MKSVTVSGISLPFTAPREEAFGIARRLLGDPPGALFHIAKKSLDARKKNDIRFVYTVCADVTLENYIPPERPEINVKSVDALEVSPGKTPIESRPVIAGFGPAGMFAGLMLARAGYKPVILEKGGDIDTRVAAVERFWATGKLNENSNVQFGEGGAGTFSDGKLTTRINDPRCSHVLKELHAHGAPEEILYQAKPHIGTDRLRAVVKSIRMEIIKLGGEVRFSTCLTGINSSGGKIRSVKTSAGDLPASVLILAPGHSSRDLFSMLLDTGVLVVPKPFSVGVRIEHPQDVIDRALYGDLAGHPLLPKGEYQLSHREKGRAVYTFCMCPGGVVVPAASEEGMVVVNGMSEFARDGVNANCAIAVSVDDKDFPPGPLGGVSLQKDIERQAFEIGGGGYKAPVQTVDRFLSGKSGYSDSTVVASYALGTAPGDFNALFPAPVAELLSVGIRSFGRKLRGFDMPGAVLTGAETRTSSPVRIMRDNNMQSVSVRGLYPCGEGAGYAGGIMSAAVDGVRAAMAVISQYAPSDY